MVELRIDGNNLKYRKKSETGFVVLKHTTIKLNLMMMPHSISLDNCIFHIVQISTKFIFTYIWNMKTSETEILNQIRKIVKDIEPSAKIYLYGSRSRGTARDNSDWDLLILLNKDNISNKVEREITYPLYDLEFDTGEVISPMIYSEKEWNSKYKVTPFYQNVMREGILL